MKDSAFDFDPTCGMGEKELLAMTAPGGEPGDFREFWEGTFREASSAPLDIVVSRLWSPGPETEIFEVCYTSLDGVRVGGWVIRPKKSVGGVVFGHGYGSNVFFMMDWARCGFTTICFCARGMGLSTHESIPWAVGEHVVWNIHDRWKYVLRGCAADLWRAADTLLELYPDTAGNLNYDGSSFGGGLGALALPWHGKFKAAHLGVPTFGHHDSRLSHKSNGSGEFVRKYFLEHPEIRRELDYFDAATAAKYIRIPVLCSPALFDPVVLPPGQFAVANSLPNGRKFVLPAGHHDFPGSKETSEELQRQKEALFTS